jgi:release factor glutamine methyltransferase
VQNPSHWTLKSLLDWSEAFFRDKGISTPRLDGELLLAHVLDCNRIDLYLQYDRPLSAQELSAYRELVRARAGRTPVAYLVGEAGFYGLTLAVGPGCLIPRADTETLVDVALEAVAAVRRGAEGAEPVLPILEWGTGCGAIPLALCAETEGLVCLACDLSAEALRWARVNLKRHAGLMGPRNNRLLLLRCKGFEAIRPDFAPQLILANPPYVPSGEIEQLEPEVARAEPRLALDGGADGLAVHRELVAYAARALGPGGRLILEIGVNQAEAVHGLVASQPSLQLVEIRRDLVGIERVVHAQRISGG